MVVAHRVRLSGWLASLMIVALAGATLDGGQVAQSAPSIADALDRYAGGHEVEAVRAVARDLTGGVSLGGLLAEALTRSSDVERLTSDATRWTKGGDAADADRRRLIAAGFGLDVAWAEGRRRSDDLTTLAAWQADLISLVGWGDSLTKASPPSAAGRWWALASVAMLEDAGMWGALRGHASPILRAAQRTGVGAEYAQGHLAHVRTRFPGEPRWRLVSALIAGSEYQQQVWIARNQRHQAGGGGPRGDALPAELAAALAPGRTGAPRALAEAKAALDRELGNLALDSDPVLRAEASLRAGYWRLSFRDWGSAIEVVDPLSRDGVDPYLRYMAFCVRGWAYEGLGRRAEAIASYQHADALVPAARTVSTLLAAQLFLDGRVAEAHDVLDRVFGQADVRDDPGAGFDRGDARFIDAYLQSMRQALR